MKPSPRRRAVKGAFSLWPCLLLIFGSSCSPKRYERAADQEVYRLIQRAEQQVFGTTNDFSIDTRYSGRDPRSIAPSEILEDRTATNRRVLRLEDALNLAVAHSREYQTRKEQLYLTALSLSGARYQFSPMFFADSTAQLSGTPEGSDIGTVQSRVGVNQLLRTGGRLSVALANDLLRYFTGWTPSAGQTTRGSAINMISVQLTQPLLRGFGRNDPSVENLTQAERNVVYAVRSYSQFQDQFAVDVVNDFFSLLNSKDTVRNNYTNYLRRVESTEYLEARAEGQRETQSAVLDARSAELAARIGYINSVASYLNEQAAFKLTLGLPLTEEVHFEDEELEELAGVGLLGADIDREVAFRIAVERHMDIINAIDQFEDSKRKIRVAADQLRPELGIFSTASLQSEEPYDYADFDLDELRYSVGLAIDLPLDRLRERNAYRASLVAFESEVRQLSLTLDSFKDRIERGLRTLEQGRLNYLNSRASLEVARRRVEGDALRLEAGRVQIRDLRESQDALISAQNQVTSTLVAYLQFRLQLLLDMGVLHTDAAQFWIKDPLTDLLTAETRGSSPLQMPEDQLLPPNHFLEPMP